MRKYFGDYFLKKNIILVIFGFLISLGINNGHAISYNELQQSQSDYESEVQLEYGVLTLLSEVSVPSGTIFGGSIIHGFYIEANFSFNNGSIWITNLNGEIIWQDFFDEYIEVSIHLNGSSSKKYSLWANSTTSGTITLYYTFRSEIIHASNMGLAVLIIFLPIIIVIIIVVEKRRKKE